ncbi:sensor histidine kinase [Bacillus rubiinfantis]|uniref:sensor histidine kinase n=1 Tax=Bacillus rubiinfantis TaxID=1499680 RepID=UPI0005A9C1CC|nr:sensor histidine kinase [Bacillus rubiinfantis]
MSSAVGCDVVRGKLFTYLFMMLAVPIAGELKFYPIDGEGIRVSLGTPLFFFILLWSRKIHPIIAGIVTGVAVVMFRTCLMKFQIDTVEWTDFLRLHFPVFFYYVTFAFFFYLFKLHALYEKPFLIGVYGVISEIIASIVEIICRNLSLHIPNTLSTFTVIGGIAIIRSFFVLGFFNILILRESRLAEEEQRKRNEQILLLISNLYLEMLQLKKSVKNAEQLTGNCYALYRDLKVLKHQELAQIALKMAGEMHEIKKDNQRIYAGLSKLMLKENLSDFMDIVEITSIIIRANETYGEMMGKSIAFQVNISGSHPHYHTFTLFPIINNLVANAVEAIKEKGWIKIEIDRTEEILKLKVSDNGSGISQKNKPYIFEPGFTTKFDDLGVASNGIGLFYIKYNIEEMDGKIELLDSTTAEATIFDVELPIEALIERG